VSFDFLSEDAIAGFTPYVYAEGESSVPSEITFFATAGGRWKVVEVREEIVDLLLAEQVPALAALNVRLGKRYSFDGSGT
jgi:hypothetical protein